VPTVTCVPIYVPIYKLRIRILKMVIILAGINYLPLVRYFTKQIDQSCRMPIFLILLLMRVNFIVISHILLVYIC